MGPIELLMSEHVLILRTLASLEAYAEAIRRGASVEESDLLDFVVFIREFADAFHHAKEEKILFEAMVAAGFPRKQGPIAVMLMEHDEGRTHARSLAEVAASSGPWDPQQRERVVGSATAFVELLRRHIQKEDNVLYPMARAELGPAALHDVSIRCDAFEAEGEKSGQRVRLVQLAERLNTKYGGTS